MNLLIATFKRDMSLMLNNKGAWLNPLLLAVMWVSLFPIAMGESHEQGMMLSGVTVWIVAMMTLLLSLDTLFTLDVEDGSVLHWRAMCTPLWGIALAKALLHWCFSGLPLVLLAPLLGNMLSLSADMTVALMLSLLLGTPILSLFGVAGAALMACTRLGNVLLSVLILPLCIPVLIFASGALHNAALHLSYAPELGLLGALLCFALCVAPLATSAALTLSSESGL